MKLKQTIIEFFKSKAFETFLWQTANAAIIALITYIGEISWAYAVPAIGLLNYITKQINIKYLKNE